MQNKRYKYYGISSTTFDIGTQNVRHIDFWSSPCFSLPGKYSKEFFIYKKNLIIKLSSDVYIHFAIDGEIGKIAVLKKQAETLPSILNACFSIHICVEQVSMNDFQALVFTWLLPDFPSTLPNLFFQLHSMFS